MKIVNFTVTQEDIAKAEQIAAETDWCLKNLNKFKDAIVYQEIVSLGWFFKKDWLVATPKETGLELPKTLSWRDSAVSARAPVDSGHKIGDLCHVIDLPIFTGFGKFINQFIHLVPGDVITAHAHTITIFRQYQFLNFCEVEDEL